MIISKLISFVWEDVIFLNPNALKVMKTKHIETLLFAKCFQCERKHLGIANDNTREAEEG